MKAVYRSIKPYWLYLILIGKKTIEVGKSVPKAENWNKEVFLHCSKDMKSFKRIPENHREWMRKYLGKVACRFVCDKIHTIIPHFDKPDFCNQYRCDWKWGEGTACLSFTEMNDYLKGKQGYGWHISDLVIYDKPRELSEFTGLRKTKFGYAPIKITRPPQSWCYTEGTE
jgi:predicted transcriptional regulator